MTMSLPKPGFRRARGPIARPGGRGFSLVEMLAVVAILGILAIVGGQEITRTWKRQKLSNAATDIKILIQRALPEMQRRGMTTFVQVGPLVSPNASLKYLPIYLVGDANGNGALDGFANPPTVALPDLLIDEYDIIVTGETGVKGVTGVSQDFCLSVDDITKIQSNLWLPPSPPCTTPPFCDSSDWTVGRSLECDFQGRALDVTTGRQIAGPATLVLTHVDIVNGSLQPPTRYLLSVNPVWSVRIQKQIKDATNTWVDQLGG